MRTARTRWIPKIVVVALAAACAYGASYAGTQQAKAVTDARAAATERGAGYVHDQIAPAVKGWAPGEDTKKLAAALQRGILGDGLVSAVRIWTADGALAYSSVENDTTTVTGGAFGELVAGSADTVQADSSTALRTFAAAGPFVGEVQQDAARIDGTARMPWTVGRFALLGIATLLLGCAVFVGNVPAAERRKRAAAAELEAERGSEETHRGSDDDVDPEVVKLNARLLKAETSRRAMEDQLNVLRSQILSGDAGSASRVAELEGSLQDAHQRVVAAEDKHGALQARIAELETQVAGAGTTNERVARLESELQASTEREADTAGRFRELEARAVQAETAAAAHSAQLVEAHAKADRLEAQLQDALARAGAAEQRASELEAQAAAGSNGHGTDEQLRALHEQLAAAGAAAAESDRALKEALAGYGSQEQLLTATEARVEEAEARATLAEARIADLEARADDGALRARIEQLESALRGAKAEAAAVSQFADGAPEPAPEPAVSDAAASQPEVGTDAGPDDVTSAEPEVQAEEELDEDARVRAELERIGQLVDQPHETGDINGLRSRLAKTAARKKGRSIDAPTAS